MSVTASEARIRIFALFAEYRPGKTAEHAAGVRRRLTTIGWDQYAVDPEGITVVSARYHY